MMKGWYALGAVVVGCGSAATPASAPEGDGQEEQTTALATGTPVCFGQVLPMRFVLEDALGAQELAPADSCVTAEIRIEEEGDPGKYVLRYQRIGDDNWRKCESDSQDRTTFLEVCIARLMEDMSDGH